MRRQHLEGDGAVQARVPGALHLAHGPGSDQSQGLIGSQSVPAERGTGFDGIIQYPLPDPFSTSYRDLPGKAVTAAGGLRFKADEAELRRRYAAALLHAPLETLVGEAATWVLWPSTAAIWVFPVLMWRLRVDLAVLAAIGVFLLVQVATMIFYSRPLNYISLALSNRALQAVFYAGWALAEPRQLAALAAWLALMAFGVVQVIFVVPFMPLLQRIFSLAPADQALRNVARRHARLAEREKK